MASDVKNKSKLNNEILYQLYKRVVKEKKAYAPKIMNPPDHTVRTRFIKWIYYLCLMMTVINML